MAVQVAGSLMLFLLSYWLFFSYGANDLALAAPFDDVYPVLMVVPYLCGPIFIYALQRVNARTLQALKLVLICTASTIFIILAWITMSNPVFSSRWTWAYNDLREMNFLVPAGKFIAYASTVYLLFLLCHEFLVVIKDPRQTAGKSRIANLFSIILVGFLGFGVFQEILGGQPLWISVCTLAWLAVVECSCIFINTWHPARKAKGIESSDDDEINEYLLDGQERATGNEGRREKPFKVYVYIGLAAWCVYTSLYPAQLVFQEGPTNSWGTSILVATAFSFILLLSWRHLQLTTLQGFFTIVLLTSVSPVLLFLQGTTVPGGIPTAQVFSLTGLVSTFCWMMYYGYRNHSRWSPKHAVLALWLWGLGFVVFFHDPLLEVWEMEEGLIDLGFSDAYGTGIGLYYAMLFFIALASIAFASTLLLLDRLVKRVARMPGAPAMASKVFSPGAPVVAGKSPHSTTRAKTRQFHASLVIFIAVTSCSVAITLGNITVNAPVVVAEMGDHGVLWLANSYDRVLPDYHPNFDISPRNSTIDVHAMRGETEMVQLVFSTLASKMVSFQGYRWNSSGDKTHDYRWKEANGTLVEIPITTGQMGYLNCFDPRIADVLFPWTSFITGSGSRQNIPFWLEVSVPRNMPAGVYTTQFEYLTTSYLQRVPRTASLKFTIRLTVWNYTKPLNRTVDTCVGLYPENPQNKDPLLKLATRFGADPYGYWFTPDDIKYNASNLAQGITINWTTFDAQVQDMLDAGMNQIKVDFYPGIDCRHNAGAVLDGSKDNYLTLIRWFYENATVHLASKTTPWGTTWASETITQHSDEPDPRIDPLAPAAFDLVYKIVHNASNGTIRSFQTFAYEPAFDEWLYSLDIWVLTPDSFSPGVASKIRAAGNEIWTYSNGDNFPGTDTDLRTPLIMSRLRGWVNYHYNISGFLHWVFYWNYNDAGRSGCGYDGRGDGTLITPHDDGYVPTLRLAAFRDGLEDNELLWALNKTIAIARLQNVSSPILDEAIATMQSVDAAMGKQWADMQWPLTVVTREFNHDARTYMNLRTRCGNALEQLKALL